MFFKSDLNSAAVSVLASGWIQSYILLAMGALMKWRGVVVRWGNGGGKE